MRRGKMVAQGAHASNKVLLRRCWKIGPLMILLPGREVMAWLSQAFTKISAYVQGEDELLEIYEKALAAEIPCSLIRDNGKTEFKGVPTYTAVAVGPAEAERIDPITGHLPLL